MKKFIAMVLLSGLAGSLPAQTADAGDKSSMPDLNFPAVTSGEAAVRLLGKNVSAVAKAHGKQADELVSLLRRDRTLKLDRKGRLFYADDHLPAPQQASTANGELAASADYPLTDTFKLHSRPGVTKKLYLDFDGYVMTGTAWNNSSGQTTINCPPYDTDGNPSTFSDGEKTAIQSIWKRVAEDYSPFDVDVTTEDPGNVNYGMRVLISPIHQYFGNYGGIAYIGVFGSSGDYYKPALVFPEMLGNGYDKYVAEAISHEAGHTFGLNHDGTPTVGYYQGNGSGATGWAPIMGVGYYQNVAQWSKGEYPSANNTEDDLAIIASKVGYRPDDHGNTLSAATALPASSQLSATGVIANRTDVDVFSFQSGAGTINISVNADSPSPNLDVLAELLDASGTVIASDNPSASLNAGITASVPAGTYYLRIDGVGFGTTTVGYSDYASVGQYTIAGTVPQPAVNNPPVADSQGVTTAEDTVAAVTLTGSDPEGGDLTYSVVTGPAHGTLSGGAPILTYTPAANYNGSDSFTFRTSDGMLSSAIATVSITVTPVNDAPVAISQSVTTVEDTAKAITLTGSDPEGGAFSYSVVTGPAHGTLGGVAPILTYTPAANYNGLDSFTFRTSEGSLDSATATVSITVTAVNDAPVAISQSVTTAEDTAAVITLTGSDPDGGVLTYSVVTGPAHGTLGGTAPNLTYTPAANYNGSDSFTFRTSDGSLNSTATITISVTAVNDAPVANNQSVTAAEDTAKVITLTGSDPEGVALTYSVVTGPFHGTLGGVGPNQTYTPAANYNGLDSFTFRTSEGSLDSATATVSITVTAVNDAPVAISPSVTTAEDTAAVITLTGSDPDGGVLTYSVVTAPAHGTLVGAAPNLTYTPAANYNGSDSLTFRISDGSLNSTGTVSITVTAVNDAPVANNQSVSTSPDTAKPITLTCSDVDGDTLTFTVVAGPANGTLSGTAPNLTYTPNTGFIGNDSFTFLANDGLTDSALATMSIAVLEGPGALPAGWTSQDVGAVGIAGTAGYTSGTSVYTASGSGTGFGTDQFRYAWQTLSGDGEIKVRITGFNATTNTAQAGVMIRETTSVGSKSYFVGRRNDGKVSYTRRSNTSGSVSTSIINGAVALPYWVRLVRVGNTLTSYKSANGVSWSKVNGANITMASQITIGLAVTSGSNGATATATFDNVTVVP